MSLSPQERELLDEIERCTACEDPRFARTLSRWPDRRRSRIPLLLAAAMAFASGVSMVLALAAGLVPLALVALSCLVGGLATLAVQAGRAGDDDSPDSTRWC